MTFYDSSTAVRVPLNSLVLEHALDEWERVGFGFVAVIPSFEVSALTDLRILAHVLGPFGVHMPKRTCDGTR